MLSCYRAKNPGETKALHVIAARVGEIAFLGLDCEALVEIGLAIKASSPYKYTFVITNCNGWNGYLAPRHCYAEGGYQVAHSGFSADAVGILTARSVKLLESLR